MEQPKHQRGSLPKIANVTHNLPSEAQVESVPRPVGPPKCTVREDGHRCDQRAISGITLQMCRDHMRAAYLLWKDHLAKIYGYDTTEIRPMARPIEGPAPERPVDRRQPFVYYIRFGDRIKIGFTLDLPGRLANLPYDEVLAIEPGPIDLERMRHQQFANHRITRGGEWFRSHEDLLTHIEMLVRHFGTADAQLVAIGVHLRPKSPSVTA